MCSKTCVLTGGRRGGCGAVSRDLLPPPSMDKPFNDATQILFMWIYSEFQILKGDMNIMQFGDFFFLVITVVKTMIGLILIFD